MKQKSFIQAKTLSYISLMISLSTILGMITFFRMPQGGSVTLFSMLPMVLITYFYGFRTGIVAGIALSLLNFFINPTPIVHPFQFLLDYPLAFGALGLGGINFIRKRGLIPVLLVGVSFRFLAAFLSGYIFFKEYAPEHLNFVIEIFNFNFEKQVSINPYIYSIYYNLSYLAPETLLTVILLSIKKVRKKLNDLKYLLR